MLGNGLAKPSAKSHLLEGRAGIVRNSNLPNEEQIKDLNTGDY